MSEKYSDNDIVSKMSVFGTVYLHEEITDLEENIIGNKEQKDSLRDFFNALKNFATFKKKLKHSLNLFPNLTMLLYGPPGTGKTSLVRAFARKEEYKYHVCVVESDKLVSSLLGETIKNIRMVVETAADIVTRNKHPFILFFDEIDAIGSERSNIHEVGEIKRAVISFLQTIDRINLKGIPLAIIGATNHQKQLDSAIWRRFTFHLKFDIPKYEIRVEILKSFLERIKFAGIEVEIDEITKKLTDEIIEIKSIYEDLTIGKTDKSLSEDTLISEVRKRNETKIISLTHGYSGSDIERGVRVALFKQIGLNSPLTYEILYNALELVGGTATHVERQVVLSESIQIEEKESEELGTLKNLVKGMDKDIFKENLTSLTKILQNILKLFKDNKDLVKSAKGSNTLEAKLFEPIVELFRLKDN